MNDIIELTNLQLTNTSFFDFFIGLLSTSFFVLIVRLIYLKYSSTVSNKSIISKLFFIFGVSIYLIVVTIKTSIVLSLGLVGALSIIRFRTAIKEPEQIIYFLFITGIAISTAAESFIFPLLSVLCLYFYVLILDQKNNKSHFSQNDQIIIECKSIDNSIIEQMVNSLNHEGVNVEIQSIRKETNHAVIVLKLSDFFINHLEFIEKYLQERKVLDLKIQFFSSPD
ncbi:MAG: DUF4956 domain-containing protein [Flavobacteriaceae bacterium]